MPTWLAIIIGITGLVSGLVFGALGALATFRRGDFGRPRLRHILEIQGGGRSSPEKIARRAGVKTLCYLVPSRFEEHVVLHVPHSVLNPGRLPIRSISVLATYPARFGLEGGRFRRIWAIFGGGEPEYFKSHRTEITGYGTQVVMSSALLRGGEAMHFGDFFLLPPMKRKRGSENKNTLASPLEARMKANPLIREFFEMHITTFSEMTRARTRTCNIVVLNEIDKIEPQRVLEILSDTLWAGGRPTPGLYTKYPWSPNPFTWEFADIIRPDLGALAAVDGEQFYLESPSKSEFARGVYFAPAVNYRDLPSNLSPEQRENYLGISRVYTPGIASSVVSASSRTVQALVGAVTKTVRRIMHAANKEIPPNPPSD